MWLRIFFLVLIVIHDLAKGAPLAQASSEGQAAYSIEVENGQQEDPFHSSDQGSLSVDSSSRIHSESTAKGSTNGFDVELLLLPSRQFREGIDMQAMSWMVGRSLGPERETWKPTTILSGLSASKEAKRPKKRKCPGRTPLLQEESQLDVQTSPPLQKQIRMQ